MRLLLLLSLSLLAGAASAAQVIVGAARCTWGPAYWCGGGFRQSRECGATRHCIDNVWSKMQVPQARVLNVFDQKKCNFQFTDC